MTNSRLAFATLVLLNVLSTGLARAGTSNKDAGDEMFGEKSITELSTITGEIALGYAAYKKGSSLNIEADEQRAYERLDRANDTARDVRKLRTPAELAADVKTTNKKSQSSGKKMFSFLPA